MNKHGFNGIRTIVVVASDASDDQWIIKRYNQKTRRSLLSIFKSSGYACAQAMEKFGNFYRPYAIFNMSVDAAKKICGKYQRTSFVFSVLNEEGVIHSEYYTKQEQDPTLPYSKQANDFTKNDECDTLVDTSNPDGNLMVIGKKFKYGIPYQTLHSINETICENLKRMVAIEKNRGNHSITEERALEFTINGVGMSPYLWRMATTKGLL